MVKYWMQNEVILVRGRERGEVRERERERGREEREGGRIGRGGLKEKEAQFLLTWSLAMRMRVRILMVP